MTLLTASLRYSPGLDGPNTWRLTDALDAVEVRLRLASGPEVSARVEMRYRRSAAQAPAALHVRPEDAGLEVWTTESANVHEALPRLSLQLLGTPSHAAESMRQW